MLAKLSRVLGVSTDELLTGEGNEVRMVPAEQRKSLDELTMRIRVDSAAGDKVRVNFPVPLVKTAIEIGLEIGSAFGNGSAADSLKSIDMVKVVELVEKGLVGKLVEIESAEGDTVEVVVE